VIVWPVSCGVAGAGSASLPRRTGWLLGCPQGPEGRPRRVPPRRRWLKNRCPDALAPRSGNTRCRIEPHIDQGGSAPLRRASARAELLA
jgi:hypothetical protein